MATAADIINYAFEDIGVKSAETPVEPFEMETGLKVLNNILSEWSNASILKGVDPVDAVGDIIKCQRHEEGAIEAQLSIKLAGKFGRPITQIMIGNAKDTRQNLRLANQDRSNIPYPSTLPRGQANQVDGYDEWSFYPDQRKPNF